MKALSASRLLALALFVSSASASFAVDAVDVETEVYAWSDTAEPVAETATLAQYGPFQVVAPDRAELNGSIESDTPGQFAAECGVESGPAARSHIGRNPWQMRCKPRTNSTCTNVFRC